MLFKVVPDVCVTGRVSGWLPKSTAGLVGGARG